MIIIQNTINQWNHGKKVTHIKSIKKKISSNNRYRISNTKFFSQKRNEIKAREINFKISHEAWK